MQNYDVKRELRNLCTAKQSFERVDVPAMKRPPPSPARTTSTCPATA
ncbi:hypothetical protein [Streptomyces sp. NPDC058374]